ncbi:TlpA family protein disulfide reductase [Variovorax ginsengisoli]|uniref:Thiol-disulfide isomerase/thioredoxin n=1 Tax=Variovorax ginsengisoli TaxID=363844 RepID=A0ABT9S8K2_9BURK|nr:TlpA disulfide reductase family protein [Variovorax ginsengisoli]MDP9900685.1 thiol-disulfide isomerase/thioredoxin [Variovorax ginsengisoli]
MSSPASTSSTSPRSQAGRRGLLFGGVAAVAAAAGLGGAWWRHSATPRGERLDASVWASRFDRPEGGELDFATLKGKPVLINFWATWCPPCVEELPMVNRFYREHAPNGWQVVGLAIDQPSAVRKFLARTPVDFPIGLAGLQGTDLVRALGNTTGGLPFTLVIAADGTVAARKMGKLEPSDLDAWLRA